MQAGSICYGKSVSTHRETHTLQVLHEYGWMSVRCELEREKKNETRGQGQQHVTLRLVDETHKNLSRPLHVLSPFLALEK